MYYVVDEYVNGHFAVIHFDGMNEAFEFFKTGEKFPFKGVIKYCTVCFEHSVVDELMIIKSTNDHVNKEDIKWKIDCYLVSLAVS